MSSQIKDMLCSALWVLVTKQMKPKSSSSSLLLAFFLSFYGENVIYQIATSSCSSQQAKIQGWNSLCRELNVSLRKQRWFFRPLQCHELRRAVRSAGEQQGDLSRSRGESRHCNK